jgi:uncharacterized membrane protein YdjX (TVP38/TMEM64 family)
VNSTIWLPAFAGMTLEGFPKTDSLDLGKNKFEGKILNRKNIILLLLVLAGLILHQTGIIDWLQILEHLEKFSDYWWAWSLILGIKIVFYALALPGSSLIWVAAVLYKPLQATLLIVCGGTLGGFAGYFISKRISQKDNSEEKKNNSMFFDFLEKNSNFLALCAVRMVPGIPHSVINYGSGILNVPWLRFVSATMIGFAVKGFVYASAIHETIEISDISEIGKLQTLWPLLILAGLMMLGHVFQHFLTIKQRSGK